MARFLALIVATALFAVPVGLPSSAEAARFTPKGGPTFNSAVGDAATRRAIFNKIVRTVRSAHKGSQIKVLSWNFLTREGTDALLGAQKRGVRVRVLMDSGNKTKFVNQPFQRLHHGLKHYSKSHKKAPRSWARVCQHSCRGKGGAAHAKFFLFSHAGRAHDVVIQGSANFTQAASNNQWNDVFTYPNQPAMYAFMSKIFDQASKDKPVRPTFQRKRFGNKELIMFPVGRSKDPIMKMLDRIRCQGATNTRSHRTRIRIAPDVIRSERGMRLGQRVRQLWEQGCDIRIGYTVLGIAVGKMLRDGSGRGPVPMKHLVQDFDGDGQFDNYFHLKAMTVVGHVGKDRSSWTTVNGSANWSGLARASDENLGVFHSKKITKRYQEHLNYWYKNFPASAGRRTVAGRAVTSTDPDQLVFGTGSNAELEDGTPYSDQGIDPYANLQMD